MRKKEVTGTRYDAQVDKELDANQQDLVDEVTKPHSYVLPENVTGGGVHKICASYPAHNDQAQAVQARGRIVWNRAYKFQPHGPSYLDPIPDQEAVPDGR